MGDAFVGEEHTTNEMGMEVSEEALLHGRAGLRLASISDSAAVFVNVAVTADTS